MASPAASTEHWLAIEGMDCAACAAPIEAALQGHEAVASARVSVATGRACLQMRTADVPPALEAELMARVQAQGFKAYPVHSVQQEQQRHRERRQLLWQLFVAAFCMMQVMMLATPEYVTQPGDIPPDLVKLMRWGQWMLSIPVLLFAFPPIALQAINGLRQGRLAMELPAAIGLALCFAWSHWNTWHAEGHVWYDSFTMFLFFLLAARWLRLRVQERVWLGLEPLLRSLNRPVERWQANGWTPAPISQLAIGDRIRLPVGERVPVDVLIEQREVWLDESVLTGESWPVRRVQGDTAPAGSLVTGMPLQGTVSAMGRDSTLGQLQSLIDSASLHRPEGLLLSDRMAQVFLAVILALAALTAVYWGLEDMERMMPAVMAVLIVTCPCALSLAAPSGWLAATVSLAKRGIWVRRVESLEILATASRVLLDKTGTLTAGLTLLPPISLGAHADPHSLQMARALAHQSSHPLSRAIDAGLAEREVALLSLPASHETAGQGMALELDGVRWELGRPLSGSAVANQVELRRDGEPVWGFVIDTPVDPQAGRALAWLRRQGLRLGVLSGDRPDRAEALWQALGGTPDEVQAGLDPAGKLARLEALQTQRETVVMVGDGINDAPVMSRADVSVAVGRAVPLARAQADVVLAHDGVQRLPELLAVARRTRRVIRLNLLWAAAYNLLSVPLAAAGLINPWMAGLGMALSSLLVLGHSLRLLKPITLE